MKILYQTLLLTCALLLLTNISFAQDIIIKTDKSEIKAKVIELEATNIKYKLFDYQDGPTYNLPKQEIFMIIYQNGKRETFATSSTSSVTNGGNTSNNNISTRTTRHNASAPSVHLRNGITAALNLDGFNGGMVNFTLLTDGTIWVKSAANYLRTGASVTFFGHPETDAVSISFLANATPHLPVNRLMGNYEKQNEGFFPFVRFGAGLGVTMIEGDDGTDATVGFAHQVAFGADYLFSRKFGVTAYTDKFQTFSIGASIRF